MRAQSAELLSSKVKHGILPKLSRLIFEPKICLPVALCAKSTDLAVDRPYRPTTPLLIGRSKIIVSETPRRRFFFGVISRPTDRRRKEGERESEKERTDECAYRHFRFRLLDLERPWEGREERDRRPTNEQYPKLI